MKPLVGVLNHQIKFDRIQFIQFDLVNQVPPEADLMICRDCLFHLSYDDTLKVLKKLDRVKGKVFINNNS